MTSNQKPDSLTRLLDMLAGWEHYSATNAKKHRDEECEDAIGELYSKAGDMVGITPEEDANDEQVKTFIIEKVIPLVLNGKR